MSSRTAPRRPVPGDLIAGISVALLLIPQSVAYAALAGLPPAAGLLAAAAAPIGAAFFASSPYLQTGPVAITSLLVLGGLTGLAAEGSSAYVGLAALLALGVGLVRLVLGLVGGGVLAYLMSAPVVAAFTAAAALLILLSQLPAALGVSVDSANPVRGAVEALLEPAAWDWTAIAFAAVTIAAVTVGRRVNPLIPVVPILVVVLELLAQSTGWGGAAIGGLDVALPGSPLALPWGDAGQLLLPAVVIALVGFAEPAAIARRLAAEDRQHWSADRELVSQGAANLAAGLVGGYPVGGSFSRSTLNRLAGARTRWSGLVTGLFVLAMLPVLGVLSGLPRAVLSGIVIASVVNLLDPRPLFELWGWSRAQTIVSVVTYVSALVLAPRIDIAVVLGVGLAIVVHLWRELQLRVPADYTDGVLHVRPSGVLYFASAPGLAEAVGDLMADHPETERVVVHLEGLGRMDVTGAAALRSLLADIREAGVTAEVCSVPPQLRRLTRRMLSDDLSPECRTELESRG